VANRRGLFSCGLFHGVAGASAPRILARNQGEKAGAFSKARAAIQPAAWIASHRREGAPRSPATGRRSRALPVFFGLLFTGADVRLLPK